MDMLLPTVYTICQQATPVKKRTGRLRKLTVKHVRKLIRLAESDAEHRQMPFVKLAWEAGFGYLDERAIRRAMAKEGYYRFMAMSKP